MVNMKTFVPEDVDTQLCCNAMPVSGMENAEIDGTILNQGKKEAERLAITALFIDEAHGKIAEKPGNLLPNEQINIHADEEKKIPKKEVKVRIKVE